MTEVPGTVMTAANDANITVQIKPEKRGSILPTKEILIHFNLKTNN